MAQSSRPAARVNGQDTAALAASLLATVQTLLQELYPDRSGRPATLDSRLTQELGLDSLARTELLRRLERQFQVTLPAQCLNAETPRDWLSALLNAQGAPVTMATTVQYQPPTAADAPPDSATTLLEVLDWHVNAHAERTYLYLYETGDTPLTLSYGELYEGARRYAAGLRGYGVQPGQCVAFMLPTGRDYFFTFFGTLLAGAVPVPLYPPTRPSQIEEHLRRHARILDSARAPVLVTVPEARHLSRLLQAQVDTLRHVLTAAELAVPSVEFLPSRVRGEALALVQYTSGSTGDPKGVMLSHANLLANIRAMGRRVGIRSTDVFVSWLPLYHDMGLIGGALGTLYFALPLVALSPLDFLKQPARWLWTLHRHRGTVSAAPNFAYELCLRHCTEADLVGLDLSAWRWALCGAEPVSVATLSRFQERFAAYGLDRQALAPVYGLAECSLGLTLPNPGRGVRVERIRRSTFTREGRAVPVTVADADTLELATCGHALAGHQLRIVDADGRELPERYEGRLQFQGPSATAGYLNNPVATEALREGDWLNSGDRAYLAEGDVVITGRSKDLIIRAGRNFYPYELEQAVGGVAGVRKGCVAAFACHDERAGTERLVVVAETRVTDTAERAALVAAIRAASADVLETAVDEVVLVPPATVLKTSSGKIRRAAVRELYEQQTLGQGLSVRRQLLRLALASGGAWLRRRGRGVGEWLYAGYAAGVFLALVPPVWLALNLLPPSWGRALARTALRGFFRWVGMPVTVSGLAQVPEQPCVLVANHVSYLDALVLFAVLPTRVNFVAKQELAANPWLRRPLRRLGVLFVERFDTGRSAADAERITEAVRAGQTLLVFPEGTFQAAAGLLPFRLGAFVAAAQAGVPVLPVTLTGTRAALPPVSKRLRRGPVAVRVDAPLVPTGTDWTAALALRAAVRAVIARYCREPDRGDE